MNKLPLRIIFISALLVVLTAFIFFFIDKTAFIKLFPATKLVTKEQSNVFNSLNETPVKPPSQSDILADIFDKNGGELKSKTDGLYIFVLGSSLVDFDHEALWSYDKTPFWAEIKSISKGTSKLDLKFVSPQSIPYLNEQKEAEVVGCEKYNTFLTIENPKSTQTDLDFFSTVKNGDDMIGYCLNQECTRVGKLCKIYRD